MKKLVSIFFITITIFLCIGASLLYINKDPKSIPYQLGFEIFRFLIQLIIIVVLGRVLIDEYNRRRDRKEAEHF